jgi:predicted nucleotidyltransferase
MPPDDDDLLTYAAGWRERAGARARREAALRRARWERLPALVRELRYRFSVTRVVVFGSLARGEGHELSDVDLLVDGLAPAELIDATVVSNRMLGDALVDLLPRDLARPEVLARALEEGLEVHG